jgi:hypothetical protein
MTQSLGVTSEYLTDTAGVQTQTATDVGTAKGIPIGTGESCWWNHGLVCSSNNIAFIKAEGVRNTASKALTELCDRLAAALTVANSAYTQTDANAGQDISTTI